MHVQSFDSYPSASIETLCCKLGSVEYIGDFDSSKRAFMKFMKFQFLSEIELKSLFDRDNSMFSVLTDSFRQPWQLISLKRLRLGHIMTYNICSFFDALFSMPKEQLSEFTLELQEVQDLNQQDIVSSWKSNSRGQKLKNLKFVPPHYYSSRRKYIVIIEDLRSIAVEVTV